MSMPAKRVSIGELTFDSHFSCGNGYDFTEIAPGHYRFWTRAGSALYSWRFFFRILSPGDGREIILEAADFNHAGRTVWNESAAVRSTDREHWRDIGQENISVTDYTPGDPPLPYGDSGHIPYGVRCTVRLDAPEVWVAVPVPFTPKDRDRLFTGLAAAHPEYVRQEAPGETYHSNETGHPVTGMELTDFSIPPERKIRCVVIAGEHPSESAGMYACRGMMEALADRRELLRTFDFHFVPIVNIDGVCSGRSYHNTIPGGDDIGYNISMDYEKTEYPETRYIYGLVEKIRPHFFLRLHNGRHRDRFECFVNGEYKHTRFIEELGKALTIPLDPPRESNDREMWVRRHCGTPVVMTFETLLLRKNPPFTEWKESYLSVGRELLDGITNGLNAVKTQLNKEAEHESDL